MGMGIITTMWIFLPSVVLLFLASAVADVVRKIRTKRKTVE